MRTTTDPADFLRNPIRYIDSFNLTNSTLAQFTPNNSVIFLGTHKISFTSEVAEELNYTSDDSPLNNTEASGGVQFPFPDLDTIERLYRTPFHREHISDELLMYWDVAKDDRIQLPAKNQYIPEDFTIYPRSVNDSDNPKILSNPDNDDRPVSMWWLLDTDDFHEPRVNIMCQLNNTNAGITAAWEGKILMILYVRNLRGRKALSVGDYGATVGVISVSFNLPNMSMLFFLIRFSQLIQIYQAHTIVYYCITAQSRLFARFLETIVEPTLYDATLVGYSYSVESYTHGLMLSFSGPTDKMSQLISGVVSGAGMMYNSILFVYQFYLPFFLFCCTVLRKESLLAQAPLFNIAKASLIDELENFNFTELAFRYTYQYLQK